MAPQHFYRVFRVVTGESVMEQRDDCATHFGVAPSAYRDVADASWQTPAWPALPTASVEVLQQPEYTVVCARRLAHSRACPLFGIRSTKWYRLHARALDWPATPGAMFGLVPDTRKSLRRTSSATTLALTRPARGPHCHLRVLERLYVTPMVSVKKRGGADRDFLPRGE